MQISVIGSGYVGLVAATCLAELGHDVVCVDNDSTKIAALNAGQTLIHEDCLHELLSRHRGTRLSFSTSIQESTRDAAVIFIAVGTPSANDGSVDLSCVESVAQSLSGSMNGYKVIVEKSTVPVYTSEWIQDALSLKGRAQNDFDVVSNPEFLREGTAVTDFLYPDRIVVGASTERAASLMREIYAPLIDGSYGQLPSAVPKPEKARLLPMYIETSPRSAELIKHASNAFLALKISFINAVASFCEAVGANIEEVCKGIGSDSRIGPEFLRAGIGYGGSCFPKDVAAFRAVTHEFGYEFPLLDEIKRINEEQRIRFIRKVKGALRTLKGKRLAVLGLAFKDGTDDVRESPAIKVIEQLLQEKCQIIAFDPAAMDRARQMLGNRIRYAPDAYTAADGADALLILTEWKEFAHLDLARIKRHLKSPIVLDGRNVFSQTEMAEAGLNYHSIGRPTLEASNALLKKGHIAR
ncbi:MAG TPA: UDP-glucose/GDP-mannose dehydrogenase family protein [Candidatus Angelobacter sp.]|jgi:UDPglucose 6-dehydrogenase|nr:UDP-glucose/GDP-mannose dehydrogenase family protein [Candidatus Angelobacter sp.]